ncbi:MAG: hypoxanthine phosphoribosyltransferase [Eggerthellaceae bacterium]|nr:hypoxanthine phosphoribosyltransferase [Eggerthellaceae bacterium]
MHKDVKEILYDENQIAARVKEMGAHLTEKYRPAVERGERIVLLCVLRGAAIFMADLARAIDLPLEMDYMAVSSYGAAAKSSGVVSIKKDLGADVAGKHLIIAEDVLDTGLTLQFLIENLQARNPASVAVVTFLRKDVPGQADIDCLDIGFTCPNEFIVGYGLDFAEHYRNLPYLGILKPEIYS